MSQMPFASDPVSRRHFLRILGGGIAIGAIGNAGLAVAEAVGHAPSTAPRGFVGEYGFLSPAVMGPQPEDSVRARIAIMARQFGIRQFQFYDWFADYSTPVAGDNWTDPYFRRISISRRTIQLSIDEVHRQGGRAWAYVQTVASEDQGLEDPKRGIFKLIDGNGKWHWHPPGTDKPRFPTYFANAAWARHMTQLWAPAVKNLGFDGIHWDTLGRIAGDYGAETDGIHAFLQTARPLVEQSGLRQTMNMVDMAWWDREIVRGQLEFPYVEAWSNDTANRYYSEMDSSYFSGVRGVIAMYPSTAMPAGSTATDVIRARHNEALKHHLSYLIIGDGARRMKNEYWPDTVPLSATEIALLQIDGT